MPASANLSKIQSAFLRYLKLAAMLTGQPARVPTAVATELAINYFRAARIPGALQELERLGWLTELPGRMWHISQSLLPEEETLPGETPVPLERGTVQIVLRRAGIPIVALPPGGLPPPPLIGSRKRWIAVLADHLFVESWYGGALCAKLSREVFFRHYPTMADPTTKRSHLTAEGWLLAIRLRDDHRKYDWRVTEQGMHMIKERGARPTFTTEEVEGVAGRLRVSPLNQNV